MPVKPVCDTAVGGQWPPQEVEGVAGAGPAVAAPPAGGLAGQAGAPVWPAPPVWQVAAARRSPAGTAVSSSLTHQAAKRARSGAVAKSPA